MTRNIFKRHTIALTLVLSSLLLAMTSSADTELSSYAITGYEMTTVSSSAGMDAAVLTLDINLPEDELLPLPILFQGTDTTAEVSVHFNNTALFSFTHDDLIDGYFNALYVDISQFSGQQGELRLTLESHSAPVTLILVEDVRDADGWPGQFSGTAPDASLQLPLNNIGELNASDGLIYTCLAIMANNQPSHLDGVPQFDIAFEITSYEQGLIQVVNSRPFNPTGALTDAGEAPSCSGQFETTTNLYKDTVSVSPQTFRVTFELIDGEALILQLLSLEEL